MRVIHVLGKISENYTSGIANHVIDLAQFQKERGNEVLIISYLRKEHTHDRYIYNHNGIEIINLNGKSGHDIKIPFKLFKVISQFKPDIVHYHTIPIIGFLAHIIKLHSYKIVNTFHVINFNKMHEKIWKHFLDGIIVVSNSCQLAQNPDGKRYEKSKWQVIYNGINKEVFKKAESYPALDILKLIMICRIDKMKNPDHGVKIVKILNEIYNIKASLTLVGNGEYEDELKEFIKEQQCESYVQLAGFTREPNKYLIESHLFLLLSWWESFSLSALEAISCGVPVISYQIEGGFMDWFKDEECGIVAKENTPEEVARIIYELQKNKNHMIELSERAEKFSELFNVTLKYNEVFDFYKSLS